MKQNLFTKEERIEFIDNVKAGKAKKENILQNGMSIEEAFVYGYLDTARAPLRGIGKVIKDTVLTRNNCINQRIVPFCRKELFLVDNQTEFNEKHEYLCRIIKEAYEEEDYQDFTVGKAQKWVNMALKYACIYNIDDTSYLSNIFPYCHVPIDRFIADCIVNDLNVALPVYDGFSMPKKRPFSAERCNYSWSNIDSYDEYLVCQEKIKSELRNRSPVCNSLKWEYDEWLKEKERKKSLSCQTRTDA
ncbi:MAG: hypothetical protein ACI4XE_06300 [Acutalibacteraceae bacterium]